MHPQDAIERGHELDCAADTGGAVRCYRLGLQAALEGLRLQVPNSGLSAKADTVSLWKDQLNIWQQRLQARCGSNPPCQQQGMPAACWL
jgi:hypothetical protein